MKKPSTQTEKVLGMAKTLGILRVKDLLACGIHPENLRRLCRKGQLVRSRRGLYMLANADVSENITLATVARRFPRGVICLLSALRFHGIGTQNPPDVWIAFKRGTARPEGKDLPLRVVLFSAASFASGMESRMADRVRIRITNPAKTVADCFKYRNKIGLDVALEALREAIRHRKCTHAEIWKYAKVCRIASVMRPYLESIE